MGLVRGGLVNWIGFNGPGHLLWLEVGNHYWSLRWGPDCYWPHRGLTHHVWEAY